MKKFLSIVIAITLVFSCVAIPASAVEVNEGVVTSTLDLRFNEILNSLKSIAKNLINILKILLDNLSDLFGSNEPVEPTEPSTQAPTTEPESTTEPETTEIAKPYLVAKQDTVTIDRENGVVYGFKEYLLKEEVLDYIKVNDGTIGEIKITYVNDASYMTTTGTGTKIEVIDTRTNEVVESFYMVIFGDLDGDSTVSAVDATIVYDEADGVTSWSDKTSDDYSICKSIAADLDHNGVITDEDALTIGDTSIGIGRIDQSTGIHSSNA